MPLSSSLRFAVAADLTKVLDLGTATAPTKADYNLALATGTGAGQADLIFSDQRTLAASAAEDLDLAGVLTDGLGTTLTFAKIKALIVKAASTNTNNVIVGGAATNGFVSWAGGATHTVTVRPGGYMVLATGSADTTGYAVTAGTADLLKIANSGGTTGVTYDVIIIGTSA